MPHSPLLPSMQISPANVEKVVKPPQKPVMSIALCVDDIILHFSNMPEKSPKSRQPIMLTQNVPNGKGPDQIKAQSLYMA